MHARLEVLEVNEAGQRLGLRSRRLFENKVNWFAAWQPRIEKEERG